MVLRLGRVVRRRSGHAGAAARATGRTSSAARRQGYINALVRLKGGESAIPKFRHDLARVTGRRDIDVWNNLVNFGAPAKRTTDYEAACLLAFGLAALAAALFLVGQSVARYTAASVSDLQLLRAPGITPRETTLAASASPLLASVAGAIARRRDGDRRVELDANRRGVAARAAPGNQRRLGRSWSPAGSSSPSSCCSDRSRPLTQPSRPAANTRASRRSVVAGRRGQRRRAGAGADRHAVRARARTRQVSASGPAGPRRRRRGGPRRARCLHLLGGRLGRSREPGQVRPDRPARGLRRARTARTSARWTSSRMRWPRATT